MIGLLGELSLGHAGFMSVGLFSDCLVAIALTNTALSLAVRLPVSMLAGGLTAALFGLLVGLPTLRLRGDYLAIVTLACGEIIKNIITNLRVTGGALGLNTAAIYAGAKELLPYGAALVLLTVAVMLNLKRSKYGRAIMAIRDNRIAAESVVLGGMGSVPGSVVSAIVLTVLPERDADKSPVLECVGLGVTFGGLKAVEDFDLTIGRTEIAGLIGPNGAGKTTVFNLLTKVYQPTAGAILPDGKDTHAMTTAQVNRAGIARTFQNIWLFNDLTVAENLMVAMGDSVRYGLAGSILHFPRYAREERIARERAEELLSIFRMEGHADERAGSLPYGAQRRLEILRALASNPCLLLLDGHGAGFSALQAAAEAAKRKAGCAALCHVRPVTGTGIRTLFDENRALGADHVLAVSRRKCALLCRGHRAGLRVQGQPGVLQVSVSHHGVSQAHELFFSAARSLRRGEVHPLRQVSAGLPYERGGQQGIPQAEKRDGVHPLLRVHEDLSHQGAALTVCPDSIGQGFGISSFVDGGVCAYELCQNRGDIEMAWMPVRSDKSQIDTSPPATLRTF